MRKSLIEVKAVPEIQDTNPGAWLDLHQLATVEITSEDPLFPIEHALGPVSGPAISAGWRASSKGPQVIRLNFDAPTAIHRIQLHFVEPVAERSQEFALYARGGNDSMREIVRQQFSFSPRGATGETEDYTVDLSAITSLELRIDPDRAHDPAHSEHFAALASLRLA
jgi:hypothetical protein